MSFRNEVIRIIVHAKNRDEKVLEKLSENSKDELKPIPEEEIIDSLYRFFSDVYLHEDFTVAGDVSEVLFEIQGSKDLTKLSFLKENDEWKLKWNMNALKSNR